MSPRLKLTIAYDGRPFAGWQSQSHHNSIQDHLERVFKRITGESVRVHGAGRTDAGVHALSQCAHVDVSHPSLTPSRWMMALNASLPPSIRILRCQFVGPDFHARYSAKGKVYRYRIWAASVLPPLEHGLTWHLRSALNYRKLQAAAAVFVGTHDFAGFAANRGKPEADTVRTLYSVTTRRRGPRIAIEFNGNGFLYKMVRLMVGAIVQCGTDKLNPSDIEKSLQNGHLSRRIVAPPEGLFLLRVRY